VAWSATEVRTRRYSPTVVRSEPDELESRFRWLRRRKIRGYIEVEIADAGSPRLAIGFRGEYAVIQLKASGTLLLAGDGSVPKEAYVEVPIVDELVTFTGDVVFAVHRAWDVIGVFLRTGRAEDLGEWLSP
jgi:hypothetical protein